MRPPILDRHILALDVPGFTNALPECGQKACTIGKERPRAAEEPDHRHGRLLRARRERPRHGRAAEQRDELAALHSITSFAAACSVSGTVRPIAFAVLRLITRSNFVGCSIGSSPGFVPFRILSTYPAARRNRS